MIERIRRALGISCVEIYLLALFERHNVDRNEVFMESYIPLHRLISDFTENVQTNFASYAGLERVQSIAARKKMAGVFKFAVQEKYGFSILYVPR